MTVSIPCHLRSGEKNESAPRTHRMSLILRLARKSVSPNSSSSFSTFLSWLFPSSLSLLIDVGDKSLRYLCPYSERASAHSAISSSALPPILRSTLGHFFLPLSHFRFFFPELTFFEGAARRRRRENRESRRRRKWEALRNAYSSLSPRPCFPCCPFLLWLLRTQNNFGFRKEIKLAREEEDTATKVEA